MDRVSYLVLIFIASHLLLISLAQEVKKSNPKCTPFYCGKFGPVSFPFTNHTQPECGLLIIYDCNKLVQKIQLGKGGPWFAVASVSQDNTLRLRDLEFQSNQIQSLSCDTFRNLSLPISAFLTFELRDDPIKFKCPSTQSYPANYSLSCNDSRHYVIYDNYKHGNLPSPPAQCSLVHLLVNNTKRRVNFINLFTGRFRIRVNVIQECYQCYWRGGKCQSDGKGNFHCSKSRTGLGKVGLKLGTGLAISATGTGILILAFCFWKKWSSHNSKVFNLKKKTEDYQNIEVFLRNQGSLAPKRYSYSDIKRMTNSFKHKLGQGGYGGVYKGRLSDGRNVAVKVLIKSNGNGEEFINEVASISKTSHVNIVTLLGFCFEGHKRGLIYEFVSNGSLEKFIYEKSLSQTIHSLKWESLYQIAIGIARGLEYLHRGCSTRILHFYIKPHNILLDEDFCPKISDFGLAKICPKKESVVSMTGARGTIGYIAPEVFYRSFGVVSHKSDVYSYGMMVLEMVGGRKNIEVDVDSTNEIYLPHWIYQHLEVDEEFALQGIANEEDKECARKMIIVSLWCIQTNPSDRPPISRVVDMLEGSLGSLQIPPKPFLSFPGSQVDSSTHLLD
ncbi:PR5-like receptor kinase [Pistacia vera]|uniref:PR5-like receptor kinase n=1 Tax=Pistacia vera TaxID=55513 RepID=UPI0012634478|nr:PR5-like receptor kinase [Pistacia vera]